jgi:hypothetical protein
MTSHAISEAEFAAALAAGRIETETEIRAQAVRYRPERDAVEITTTRYAGFVIPRFWIEALRDVTPDDLGKLAVWPDGSAIEIEERDIHLSVDGLLTAILPAMLPARAVAAVFARTGGRATSDAKRSTARENGRKRGRPRKVRVASPVQKSAWSFHGPRLDGHEASRTVRPDAYSMVYYVKVKYFTNR